MKETGHGKPAKGKAAKTKPGRQDAGMDGADAGFDGASGSAEEAGAGEGGGLRRRELFARVAERGNLKPKLARDVAELVLAEIAAALESGEEVNLPPLGKLKVQKRKMQGGSEVLTLKLRLGGGAGGGKGGAGDAAEEHLADPDD